MADFRSLFAEDTEPERIARRIARAGLCSRRDAERWIAAGRVRVDGRRLDSPAVTVSADNEIRVDGKPLPVADGPRLWRYHKPRGLLTTHRDPQGRRTIFETLPPDLPRVISVGRLDMDSEGLLLLTNHGGLARMLTLPSTGWLRKYRVRVFGTVDPARLAPLRAGLTLDGVRYGPITAELDSQADSNAWLTIGLREGKNREIRLVLAHLGLKVNRLIRLSFGPFPLGGLARAAVAEVTRPVLRQQLGIPVAGGGEARRRGGG